MGTGGEPLGSHTTAWTQTLRAFPGVPVVRWGGPLAHTHPNLIHAFQALGEGGAMRGLGLLILCSPKFRATPSRTLRDALRET